MKIGVYDLVGSKKHYHMESVGDSECRLIDSVSVRPLLVLPREAISDDVKNNKSPYLIDKEHVILDDIASTSIIAKTRQVVFQMDFRNVYSIDKLLYGVMSGLEDVGKSSSERRYKINPEKPADRQKYRKLLYDWFSYENVLLNRTYNEKGIEAEARYSIIPIIDNCDVDAQDCILQANGSDGAKTVLLWRSIAACLGMEEKIVENELVKDDNIYVIDSNSLCTTMSKITIHEQHGKLIPGHHLYKKSGATIRNVKSYPYEVYPKSEYADNISSYFPFKNDTHGIYRSETEFISSSYDTIDIPRDASYVICIGDLDSLNIRQPHLGHDIPVYRDCTGNCVIRGAGRFANRMSNGIISYFDECEALSMARINKDEEVEKHYLIEASDEYVGGLEVKGKPVTDLSVNLSNDYVEFYLLLGEQSDTRQLKVLRQELQVDMVKHKKVPICLEPTLVAGQGRAKVYVNVINESDREYMEPVFLDWENMKDAVDEGHPVSIEYLEEHMERTFPVNIPPVTMNYSVYYYDVRSDMLNYIDQHAPKPFGNLNFSRWPNKNAKGVDRFARENCFGSPNGALDLPRSDSERNQCIRFFKKLNDVYITNGKDISYLTPIAWTYHPEYFETVLNDTRKKLKSVLNGADVKLQSQEVSICANLFVDNSVGDDKTFDIKDKPLMNNDLLLYMYSFFKYSKGRTKMGNWMRGAYQIIMYNTSFMRYLSLDAIYNNIDDVIIYSSGIKGKSTLNQVYSYLLFLLKVRRFHSGFCKKTSGEKDRIYYTRLMYLTDSRKHAVFTSIVRLRQLLIHNEDEVVCSDGDKMLSCKLKAHDYAYLYTNKYMAEAEKQSKKKKIADAKKFAEDFRDDIKWSPEALFPESVNDEELYVYNRMDFFKYSANLFFNLDINNVFLDACPADLIWAPVLEGYLNGKGNINLPELDD